MGGQASEYLLFFIKVLATFCCCCFVLVSLRALCKKMGKIFTIFLFLIFSARVGLG